MVARVSIACLGLIEVVGCGVQVRNGCVWVKEVLTGLEILLGARNLRMNKADVHVDCSPKVIGLDWFGSADRAVISSCRRIRLPSPKPLGDRCSGWMENEVQEWIIGRVIGRTLQLERVSRWFAGM